MREMDRIARLLEQTVEGHPYYGPSLLRALTEVRQPGEKLWRIVAHLTAELEYARAVLEGTADPWVQGETTWPVVTDTSDEAWHDAIAKLTAASRALVRLVERLDDAVLGHELVRVHSTYYAMLHGTALHNAYHAEQISLLMRQADEKDQSK